MFNIREDFQTVEQFADHLAERIKERFNSTETDVYNRIHVLREYTEGELATCRSTIEQFRQRLASLENNIESRFTTFLDRLERVERVATAPTPVNAPPAIQTAPSQDENSQASTATASE